MFKPDVNSRSCHNNFIKSDHNMLEKMYGTHDLYPYWVADMDFSVAKPITEELTRLVTRGNYSYEFNKNGIYDAISSWYGTRHQLSLEKNFFIQVPGVLSAIGLLIREFSEKNDGVLIQTPVYHQFQRLIELSDRKVVENPLVIENNRYVIDYIDLDKKLSKGNVKIILLCNPHNPVGRVWTPGELQKIIDIANKYNVLVISDEIHSDIIFSGHCFSSILTTNGKNIITLLGSPAKTFGMHSISDGYIYSENIEIFDKISRLVSSLALDHGNAFSTYATISAYKNASEWVNGFVQYIENNVEWIDDYIKKELPEIKLFKPEGTYQIWFDFSSLETQQSIHELLTKDAKMGLAPGPWFGADEGYYRMNIAHSLLDIQQSFYRLKKSISNY